MRPEEKVGFVREGRKKFFCETPDRLSELDFSPPAALYLSSQEGTRSLPRRAKTVSTIFFDFFAEDIRRRRQGPGPLPFLRAGTLDHAHTLRDAWLVTRLL